MKDKKQEGGLDDTQDLIQPGDQELDANNLIDTVQSQLPFQGGFSGASDLLSNLQHGNSVLRPVYGEIEKSDWDEYERLIDGPFSLSDATVDDRRAAGQSVGEKIWYNYGVKLLPKIGSHIIGSTVGLVDGFGEVAADAWENGFSSSNWNKFFNNDFQRSLDDFNTALDEKFPTYYTSQERDLGFWQSVFGKGAANFWTNDASQGLSFVAGAVLSEYLTAGVAKAALPAKTANHLKRLSALRNTAYAQKSTAAAKMLNKISRADRIYDGLTVGRRLLTGAFYEAGVEARHNYDQIVENLSILATEDDGIITPEESAKIKNVATQMSNGVFAGNVALVGYSNMLLYRKIFGSGMKSNKKFKNKITKDKKGNYKAKHEDWGRFRTWTHRNIYGQGAWARYAAYEGLVEEGGQKTLDIAGQYAAEDLYLNDKNPSQMKAVGEMLNHTFDGMAEAYGSTEGQKEIFLGAVLAAIGLPSFVHTNEKGERKFKLGYGKTGGFLDYLNQYKEGRKEVEDLVKYMNENPDAIGAIKNNFDMLVGISNATDQRDYANATNNDFAYKNADHDAFFAYVFSRIKGGYYGDVLDSLEDIRDMDSDTFEAMFNYESETQNMSKEQREAFLNDRKNTVIDTHKERAEKIRQVYDSLDATKLGDKSKKVIAQALSSTADLDAREQKLISEIEETGGFTLTAITNKVEGDKAAQENIFTRLKNFTMRKLGRKAKDIMENSETGREVKREVGIKEFTEPGHPALVFTRMVEKLKALKAQRDIDEANDDVDGYIERTEKIEALEGEMAILAEGINAGTAPNISTEEQQILDEYQQRDPAGYELNKDDIVKKLQDLRRIRAKRHQMLNLIQQMIDPDAANDKIQQFEEIANDILTEEERKNLPDSQQRLARKYKGKIIEFDYTNNRGETNRHRVLVKGAGNNGLVRLPQEETFKLLQRQKALLAKKNPTADELAELELIAEELKRNKHITGLSHYDLSILEKAENIQIMTAQELLLNQLQAVTSVLQDNLAENLSTSIAKMTVSKEKILSVAQEIRDIKRAIQEAKRNKQGALYVNLNRIGRRGNFSVASAKALLAELKIEENQYKEQLKQFTQDLSVLEDNSLRIQVIHTALSNPNIVSELLGTATTRQDVLQFINDLLGLSSIEEFYKNLGEKGFFDTNELTRLIGQKNMDGGFDVDKQLLEEFLELAGDANISKGYLDLMNTDLEHFRSELELLTQHRSDVERILNKMINPITGEVLMFPPDGLSESDLRFLTHELRMVNKDIETLQSIVDMMEAETEEAARSAANSDVVQDRLTNIAIQGAINDALIEYEQWLLSVQTAPAEEAELETGESFNTVEDNINLKQQEYRPSLTEVGWTKTAGNHEAALRNWEDKYQQMIENNETLTEAEQLHLQHVKSQLRFFRASYDVTNWSKNKGNRLQIVTRYNIKPEWKNKIVFFDIAKAEKSGRYDELSNYAYADDLSENKDRAEKLENIKLLLVDSNNEPILVDGELVYTDMNSSSEYNAVGMFKGQTNKDMNEDGQLLPEVIAARESFVNERNRILQDNQERFFYITGKSRGLPIQEEELNPVLGRLKVNKKGKYVVAGEEDLKNIRLEMALPAKGVKGADQKVTLFNRFSVTSRFVYFGTEGKGYNGGGNLVPGIIAPLSENRVNNIYNLSRYFAEHQKEGGINIGGKGFTSILKDQIMYGDRSKERERQEFTIYMKDDAIYFGDQGQNITLEELKDPEKYNDKHNAYKEFLRTLYFNVNSTLLNRDKQARKTAADTGIKTKRFVEPTYEKFNEVIVNEDLSTIVVPWDNYTHFLISDKGRDSADVPVRVDMPLAFDEAANVEQATIPQFKNIYLEHSSESYTKEQLNNQNTDSNRKVTKTEPNPVVETGEDKYVEVTAVNKETGQTVKLRVLQDDAEKASILQGEVGEDVEPEDTLEGTPFSQSDENIDDPYFLAEQAEDRSGALDLNKELEWFNANMPKDKKGDPIFGIDLIKGLIDGKAYGKFTKDGNILLSDLMTTPGIVYHESWHAVTRRLISPEQRMELYNEARNLRGSTKTYKGETKKMSELTDKEVDEWLAEEFREYVLADGNYTVGSRVKKSFIDRIFDRIFSALKFFVNSPSLAETLMSKINTGYFSDPNREITIYDSKTEAYYEGDALTATIRNNTMEAMTVLLFNKALKSNAFNLEDFINPDEQVQQDIKDTIYNMYGTSESRGTVYSQIEAHIKQSMNLATTQNEIDNLTKTMRAIKNNWPSLIDQHREYLKRFHIELSDEVEELDRIREQFGKPQNEIDPSIYLPKAVRVLFGTLPATKNGRFIVNESGLPKLVDFGNIMNFMYKHFDNIDPKDFVNVLNESSEKRPELKSVINRLGLNSKDLTDKSSDQMRLIVQTMMQFNQSNNTFYTQLMTRDNGRIIINSNQNRVEDKIKLLWTNQFKDRIQNYKGLGKDVNGELILNEKAKVKVGNKSKTFKEWATDARRTPQDTLQILDRLGITFTNTSLFSDMYTDEFTGIREAIDFILQDVYNRPVSNIFKGDIQANLRTLVTLESKTNPVTVDLQHINPEGKVIHGVNLKTYADVLISKFNGSNRSNEIASLMKHDNLRGSYYLQRLIENEDNIEVVVLQGMEQQFGRGKILSKGSPVDIGVMYVNSVLSKGIIPLIRTADKKTEYGIKFGASTPTLSVTEDDMLNRLQNYLKDELRVASKFNSRRKSKLHRIDTLKDTGGNLKFFQGIVPSIKRGDYANKLSEAQLDFLVAQDSVMAELRQFLGSSVESTIKTLSDYKIATAGIDKSLLETVSRQALESTLKPIDIIGMQFTYEYMTGLIEQGKLLLGDFGLYTDLFKRTSGISGTKTYPTSDVEILNWMNENMPNLLSNKEHSDTLRVSHRGAINTEAPYLDQYIDTLTAMGAPFEFIQNVNDVYSDMEEFDGGGFITLDAYRSLMFRTGKWTPAQEKFYQKIVSGEQFSPEDMAIIPPIKPQLFGPFSVDNVRLMTYHKFALFPILPGMTIGKSFDDINKDMIDNNIDYMVFESAVKVGGVTAGQEFVTDENKGGYDPFYTQMDNYNVYKPMSLDENGEPLGLQELDFSDLGIQLETAPKTKQEVTEGSQLRSLLPVNIYENGELVEEYKEFEDLIDKYHEINNTLLERDFKNLVKKLKLTKDESGIYKLESDNLEEFKEALIEEFKRRENPLHTVDSIKALLDSDTKFIDQLFEKNKIENLLYSLVNNNVVKRKMPGGQFVLQASTGFENKLKAIKQNDFDTAKKQGIDLHDAQLKPLKFYRKADPNNPNSETLAMQVYLPSRFKDKLGRTIEDINDPNIDPDLLQIIGFRIPTEGLNSMDFIEVVGFLPKSFGDTVVVPSEIVGKAGSDYDIDKLNIYFPNSYREGDTLKRVQFDPEKSIKQQGKKALQNELQTIIKDVLSHPASFDQLIAPVGAHTLKKLAKEIAMLRSPGKFDAEGNKIKLPLHETLNLSNMVNTSYRMFSGLGGIGIVATSATQHSKGQRPGIDWNFSEHEDIQFNFEGAGFSLSRVRDVNNNNKISAIIGEYVTGYVDVTKEDFVFDINAGIDYAPVHMLLVRSGVPIDQVVYFMSQPIIDEYIKEKELNNPMYSQFPLKSDDEIISDLIKQYGNDATTAQLNSTILKELIGKRLDELNPLQQQIQVQVLNDFKKYQDLAEDLFTLKNATSLETANLNNSMAIRYAKQAINRLEQDGRFVNLDELLYGNEEGPSTTAEYIKLINEADGLFAEFKLGEYISEAKEFIDGKLFEATDRNLKMFKDDVIYKMQKFENFLATTVVQNTPWDYTKLHERTKELFVGENSLPRRINELKKAGSYSDNLLIQELTPILQVYSAESNESTIDGLRLFSKKLQPYDVDLLADAFMELKELNPQLANDLIIFSALQSGYEFSPNSFFQAIPGVEVLNVLSKYFKTNKKEDRTSNIISKGKMNSLWDDFHKNYYADQKVVPNVFRSNVSVSKDTGIPMITLKRDSNYISVTTPSGNEVIGGRNVTLYDTKLFIQSGALANGTFLYKQTDIKGVKNNLVEATGSETKSIVARNLKTSPNDSDPISEPEVVNTTFVVTRNISGEIDEVLKEEDCGKKS